MDQDIVEPQPDAVVASEEQNSFPVLGRVEASQTISNRLLVGLEEFGQGYEAAGLGLDRVANMVMLGAYLALSQAVSPETVRRLLEEKIFARRPQLLELNRQALEAGERFAVAAGPVSPLTFGNPGKNTYFFPL